MKSHLALKIINRLFIVFLLFTVLFLTNFQAFSWNDNSRFATVQSLVEQGNFIIDDNWFFPNTYDKIYSRGHYYSDKPPLLSVMASLPYWTLYHLGIQVRQHPRMVVYLTNIFIMVLPLLLFFFIFYKFIRRHTGWEKEKSILLTLTMAGGTALLPFSGTLNNHLPAALLIGLTSLYIYNRQTFTPGGLLVCGLALSLAVMIDPGAIFIAGSFSFYLLFTLLKNKKANVKNILFYSLGILIPLALHCLINYHIIGSFLPGSMHPELFDYPNSAFADDNELTAGNLAVHGVKEWIHYLGHMTIGTRGFLVHNPLFVLGLVITVYQLIKKQRREYAIACLTAICLTILYYSLWGKRAGGMSYSVRWFIILIPLVLPVIVDWTKQNIRHYRLAIVLALVSLPMNIAATGSVLANSNKWFKYSFINMFKAFPGYLADQYQQWKELFGR